MPTLPQGFRAGGIYSGVKRNPNKLDLSLVVSDRPAVGVGVYTQNLVTAAPVNFDRAPHTERSHPLRGDQLGRSERLHR